MTAQHNKQCKNMYQLSQLKSSVRGTQTTDITKIDKKNTETRVQGQLQLVNKSWSSRLKYLSVQSNRFGKTTSNNILRNV